MVTSNVAHSVILCGGVCIVSRGDHTASQPVPVSGQPQSEKEVEVLLRAEREVSTGELCQTCES